MEMERERAQSPFAAPLSIARVHQRRIIAIIVRSISGVPNRKRAMNSEAEDVQVNSLFLETSLVLEHLLCEYLDLGICPCDWRNRL